MTGSAKDIDIIDAHIRVLNPRNLRRVDWVIVAIVTTLAIIGWLCLYSASRSTAADYYLRQVVFFLIGAVAACVIVAADHRFLVSLGPLMYIGALVLLVAVLLIGPEIKGGQRWLVVGPFRLQPSEQTKLVLVYMLTWYFTRIGRRIEKLHYILLAFLIAGLPAVLILKQPNLGTAACLGPIVFVMLYIAGCKKWHLVVLTLMGLSVIPWVWWQMRDFEPGKEQAGETAFYELAHHQKMRIYAFFHPDTDVRDAGWQSYQSKVTIGSGGLTGKGYLEGTQTYLRYLPEHHTDFVFSLLAEEMGFAGAVSVMALFLALFWRGLWFARICPDMSGTLLAAGAVTILVYHVFVNIAITVGLFPVTGIPLPFLSYGGSFYLTTMMCIGVLLNVPLRSRLFE